MSKIQGTQWQPTGDQFLLACKVCANYRTQKCRDCLCEKESGFDFDPDRYIKECNSEKAFFDGEKYYFIGGMRGGGKILHLEQMLERTRAELKAVIAQRDMWKQLYNDVAQLLKWMMRKENE